MNKSHPKHPRKPRSVKKAHPRPTVAEIVSGIKALSISDLASVIREIGHLIAGASS